MAASPTPSPDTTAMFTPSEVEARTGVAAATLRQWERRYGFPSPARSASGYRLYSPHDLAQIEEMLGHLRAGVSASRAAQLIRPPRRTSGGEDPAPQLLEALLAADLERAGALLSEAHSRLSVEDVLLRVMTPALAELGRLQEQGEVLIAQEHLASAFLRGRVLALLDQAGLSRFGPVVMVAGAPEEHHEFGLMVTALLLRRQGVRAEYLGANMPLGDLARYARQRQADAVLVALNGEWALAETCAQQGHLHELDVPVFYGGALLNARPDLAAALGGTYVGPDARAATEMLLQALHQLEQSGRQEPGQR